MGFLLGEREQFLLVSLTVSKKKQKKTGLAGFIRSSVPQKPEQMYFENRSVVKVFPSTNTTLIPPALLDDGPESLSWPLKRIPAQIACFNNARY